MTAQIAERLHYQGDDVAMCTNPLGDYFAMGGVNPRFESNCTALWRGYVCSWEVVDDRLYLISLNGTLEGGADATLAEKLPAEEAVGDQQAETAAEEEHVEDPHHSSPSPAVL